MQWPHQLGCLRTLPWHKYFWNFKSKWTLQVEIRLQSWFKTNSESLLDLKEYPSSHSGIAEVGCQSTQVLVWALLWPSQGDTPTEEVLISVPSSSLDFETPASSCNDFAVPKVLLLHSYGETGNRVHNNPLMRTDRQQRHDTAPKVSICHQSLRLYCRFLKPTRLYKQLEMNSPVLSTGLTPKITPIRPF